MSIINYFKNKSQERLAQKEKLLERNENLASEQENISDLQKYLDEEHPEARIINLDPIQNKFGNYIYHDIYVAENNKYVLETFSDSKTDPKYCIYNVYNTLENTPQCVVLEKKPQSFDNRDLSYDCDEYHLHYNIENKTMSKYDEPIISVKLDSYATIASQKEPIKNITVEFENGETYKGSNCPTENCVNNVFEFALNCVDEKYLYLKNLQATDIKSNDL